MLELLAVPHNGIPCIHIGFSIVLQIRSLLSNARREFRPSNQYICRNFSPSCLLFVKMCLRHVSLLSRCMPKYLVSSARGIITPLRVTGAQTSRFRVKVTCTDLASFTLNFHFLNQVWRLPRCICILQDADVGWAWDANIAVAST
jgi:hypothetical protein